MLTKLLLRKNALRFSSSRYSSSYLDKLLKGRHYTEIRKYLEIYPLKQYLYDTLPKDYKSDITLNRSKIKNWFAHSLKEKIEDKKRPVLRRTKYPIFGQISNILWNCIGIYIIYKLWGADLADSYEKFIQEINNMSDNESFEIDLNMNQKPKKTKQYDKKRVTFKDIIGLGDEKSELEEIVNFMKNPESYHAIGAKLPKGVLLYGPPGVGKTLIAKAVAGEANVPFHFVDGSSIEGGFVGSGARAIKKFFNKAREQTPCIIFIDELDSVGGRRTNSPIHPHARQTINALLTEMDGIDSESNIVVLASTNLVEVLDEALTRSGRFDLKINIPVPLKKQRFEIFQHYLSKLRTTVDINVNDIVSVTSGKTPSDIKNICNTAGRLAVRNDQPAITQNNLTEANDIVSMGTRMKSMREQQSKECTENTAWHEAGHALIGHLMDASSLRNRRKEVETFMPVHKITLLPRGGSGGHTSFLHPESKTLRGDLWRSLCIAYGGYIAEELYQKNGNVTRGPSGDFQNATSTAYQIAWHNLMDDLDGDHVNNIDDLTYENYSKLSNEQKEKFDKQVVEITNSAYEHGKKLIENNMVSLKLVADALLKYDQITYKEMQEILKKGNVSAGEKYRTDENIDKRTLVKPKGMKVIDIPLKVLKRNEENLK